MIYRDNLGIRSVVLLQQCRIPDIQNLYPIGNRLLDSEDSVRQSYPIQVLRSRDYKALY